MKSTLRLDFFTAFCSAPEPIAEFSALAKVDTAFDSASATIFLALAFVVMYDSVKKGSMLLTKILPNALADNSLGQDSKKRWHASFSSAEGAL